MGMTLTYITLTVVAIVVLALVVYLLLIIRALRGANKRLYELAGGLDQIASDTAPLSEKMTTINNALAQLLAGLLAVNGDLASVVRLFGRKGGSNVL